MARHNAPSDQAVAAIFHALGDRGFVALQDAGMTQSDGFSDCSELFHARGGAQAGLWAFCFYTRQDLERAASGGGLSLGFWADGDEAMVRAGEAICQAFREAGFFVIWNGDPGTRPEVDLTLTPPPPEPEPTADEVPMAPLTDLAALSVSVEASTTAVERGFVTRISAERKISPVGFNAVLSDAGDLLFAANVYTDQYGYECAYLRLSASGVLVAQREDRGLMPTFVTAEDGATWSLVLDPYGDRDVTRGLPLVGRAQAPEGKPMPANVGDLFSERWLVKRPSKRTGSDKVQELVLKKGAPARGKAITLQGPGYNTLLATDDGFESLAVTDGGHAHRRFDAKGALVDERALDLGMSEAWHPAVPVTLSAAGGVVLTGGAGLALVTLGADGSARSERVLDKAVMNLWRPAVCGDVVVANFNGEDGTGFVAFRGEQLVDACLIDGSALVDARTGDAIDLGVPDMVIESVAANAEGYRAVFRPMSNAAETDVVVLIRAI